MTIIRTMPGPRLLASGTAIALGLALSACTGIATNRTLYSVHQPVVERSDYVLDVSTSRGGLASGESHRLAGWFDAMGLKYGDTVALDDPSGNPSARSAVAAVASRYGLLLADDAPATAGMIPPGAARVIVTRTVARVPGCPDWSANTDFNVNNAASKNYGCATNSNLAAMVANPEDLLHGAQNVGNTVVMSNSKAIETYRAKTPTGNGDLKASDSKGN